MFVVSKRISILFLGQEPGKLYFIMSSSSELSGAVKSRRKAFWAAGIRHPVPKTTTPGAVYTHNVPHNPVDIMM